MKKISALALYACSFIILSFHTTSVLAQQTDKVTKFNNTDTQGDKTNKIQPQPVQNQNGNNSQPGTNTGGHVKIGTQRASFLASRSVSPMNYCFIIAKHSGKALTIANASTDNNATIVQSTYTAAANQIFYLKPTGDGYFYIVSSSSGKVFDITSASTTAGANLQQYDNGGASNQQFKIKATSDGYFTIIARHSSKVLDVAYSSNEDNAQVVQWDNTGNDNQKFKFVVVPGYKIKPGINYVIRAKHSGKALTVQYASRDDGAPVIQMPKDGTNDQVFTVKPAGGGYFYLVNAMSGKYLGVNNASLDDAAAVVQLTGNNGDEQKFKFVPCGSGCYNIINKHSGKVFDIYGKSTEDAAHLIQWPNDGYDNQKFYFSYPTSSNDDNELIQIVGTDQKITPQQLQSDLASQGFTLVHDGNLGPNECALVYTNSNANDISANFGLLGCSTKYGDVASVSWTAVYGGCDMANVTSDNGIGGDCKIGLLDDEINFYPAGEGGPAINLHATGPSLESCGQLSANKTCISENATLASTSFIVTDANGNGGGFSVSAGVGLPVDGAYDNGVLSVNVSLFKMVGVSFSVNVNDVNDYVIQPAAEGFVIIGENVVGAGEAVTDYFANDFSSDVVNTTEQTITIVNDAGNGVAAFTNDAASSTATFFEDTGSAIEDAGTVAVESVTSTVSDWFGF